MNRYCKVILSIIPFLIFLYTFFSESYGGEQGSVQDHHHISLVSELLCHPFPQQERPTGGEDHVLSPRWLFSRVWWWFSVLRLIYYKYMTTHKMLKPLWFYTELHDSWRFRNNRNSWMFKSGTCLQKSDQTVTSKDVQVISCYLVIVSCVWDLVLVYSLIVWWHPMAILMNYNMISRFEEVQFLF